MTKLVALMLGIAVAVPTIARSQTSAPSAVPASPFTFQEVMIPMRDGAKLQTVILRPKDHAGPLPILLQRTPYGVPDAAPPVQSEDAMMKDEVGSTGHRNGVREGSSGRSEAKCFPRSCIELESDPVEIGLGIAR